MYYPEVAQVLEELYKDYMLIINSNSAQEFLDFETKKVKKYFQHIFSSPSDLKEIKKTSSVYLKICEILRVKPSEMVHIGDSWDDDFIAPRKIGITAFYLDRENKEQGEFVVKNLTEFETNMKRQ